MFARLFARRSLPQLCASALLVATLACTRLSAASPPSQNRWDQMDYGSFLASSVTFPWCPDGENPYGIALKAVTVRVGNLGSVCFDTATLRYAAVWTGGWLSLHGTPFDGTHRPPERSRPALQGAPLFGTSPGPGWAHHGDWRDPRHDPFVPLPASWARYSGLYTHGDDVVFRYTVDGTDVLEWPTLESKDNKVAFVRHVRIAPHSQPLDLLAAELLRELRNKVGFTGLQPAPEGDVATLGALAAGLRGLTDARWHVDQAMQLHLRIPPSQTPQLFKLIVTAGNTRAARAFLQSPPIDPTPKTRGGPSRFAASVETTGRLGASTNAAYEVDLLTAPDSNPWKSWMRFGGFDFFADGARAALCTWSGDVWTVSGIDASLQSLTWRRIASGLFQPLGLKIVRDQIYVLCRDQIVRLHDFNGDGETDFYENFNNQVSVTPNFHEFALDLHTDPEGAFYFTKGAPLLGTQYWDPTGSHNGCVVRVSPDGASLDCYATGLRAPNGSGVGPNGEVTCSDNEGIWTPVCRLNWVKPGGFYGAVGMDHRATPPTSYDPPLCWLPFAIDNSAGSQVWTSSRFGPLSSSLLHLSYGKCRAFRVLKSENQGIVQGGVTPLPWKFESSAMRGRINPRDGQLYVCGLKGWQTTAARDGALHRVRFTGRALPLLESVDVDSDAIRIRFNTPVDESSATDLASWNIQGWNYKWSQEYGSDLYSIKDPTRIVGKKGELKGDPFPIHRVQIDSDKHGVRLQTDPLRPVMQWMIRANLKTAAGEEWPIEYYGTLNAIPGPK